MIELGHNNINVIKAAESVGSAEMLRFLYDHGNRDQYLIVAACSIGDMKMTWDFCYSMRCTAETSYAPL